MKQLNHWIIILVFFSFNNQNISAQESLNTQVNILFGLNQPILNGFNAEVNFFHEYLVFEYSHGISLNLSGVAAPAILSDLGLEAHIPYTTGFGIGYRFNNWFNVRFEPKWHQFEILYTDSELNTPITTYNTTTLGIGLYGNWRPFRKKNNLLKGIMISPSIRYWYNVHSTLDNNEFQYYNNSTEQNEVHQTLNIGVNNTPLIINISIGYSIDLGSRN